MLLDLDHDPYYLVIFSSFPEIVVQPTLFTIAEKWKKNRKKTYKNKLSKKRGIGLFPLDGCKRNWKNDEKRKYNGDERENRNALL